MLLTHEYDMLIDAARVRTHIERLLGERPYNDDLPHTAPAHVTDTERWEWPLVCELTGRGWQPSFDPGRALFFAEPLMAHGDGPMTVDHSATRVVVCGTRAELDELYSGRDPGHRLLDIYRSVATTTKRGMGIPAFSACSELAAFWPTFFGSRWYVDPGERTLPALVIATGNMRNHSRAGGETVPVRSRLEEITTRHGIGLAFIEP
jgi:hypothetical protein